MSDNESVLCILIQQVSEPEMLKVRVWYITMIINVTLQGRPLGSQPLSPEHETTLVLLMAVVYLECLSLVFKTELWN